jgi:hypothetical protein
MMKFSKTLAILPALLLAQLTFSQTFNHVNYQGHDSLICNPERGFMHFSEVSSSGSYNNLDVNTLLSYRDEGITLIYRGFYLEDFTSSDISGDFLLGMKNDFEILREAGMKAVIRFSYCESMTKPYGDAPIDIVLRHIEQVKPILQENSDVILVVQAGFIGAWGEWYYTDYYAFAPGVIFPEHWALRRQIVNALLDAVPATRQIEVRTPKYKQILIENDQPVSEQQAYSDVPIARVSHHNDCFLSSVDDYGTYDDTLVEKPYLEADTKYTMIGGETCNPAPPYSDCPNSLHEMQRFHWTYLNWDYNVQLLNGWRTQGCFPEVENKMGYRYRLVEADIQDSASPGGEFQAVIKLINEGWSNPVNPRNIELVIRSQVTGEEYVYNIDEDIRFRPLGEIFTITASAGIPQGLDQGDYKVFLNMPDPEISLRSEPKFSIRTANTDTWEGSSGMNFLLTTFTVADAPGLPAYNGTGFFYPRENTIIEASAIKIDGQADDWQQVGIAYETANQPAKIFKAYNSGDSLYFLIQGNDLQADYQFFIDADNLPSSGYNAWQWKTNGSDYLLENGLLYKHTGSSAEWSWELIKGINAGQNDLTIETGLAIADLNDVPLGYQYSAAFVNDPQNLVQASYLPVADSYFIPLQRLMDYPKGIGCTGSGNKVVVYWPGTADESVYNVLERSLDNSDYQQVAILQHNSITYTDANLEENMPYRYRVYRTDGISVSPASPSFSITTSNAVPYFIEIVTDGLASDWNIIPPVATGYDDQLNAMRMVNYGDSLFFSLEGPEVINHYKIYMNTDRSIETGLPNYPDNAGGFDFLISNDSLFSAGSQTWNFVKMIVSVSSGSFLEGGLKMEEVDLISSGSAYVYGRINDSDLPESEAQAEFIKMPQPGIPLYFNVKNSQSNPDTRIVVEWSRPGNCQGFIIERSVGDSVHFKPLVDLPYSETYYHDNTVDPDTIYLYRMYAYSSLNRSAYTAIYGGYPGKISGISESSFNAVQVKVYPNPFNRSAKVEVWMRYPDEIRAAIYSVTGQQLLELYHGKAEKYNYFDIPEGLLEPGIYFIRLSGANVNLSEKIISY